MPVHADTPQSCATIRTGQVDHRQAKWTPLTTADPVASTSSCQPISLTSTSWRRAPYPGGCAVAGRGLAFPTTLRSAMGDLFAICPERSPVSKRLSGAHQLRSV